MSDAFQQPWSEEAELSVLGQMLAKPEQIGEVAATMLRPEEFFRPWHQRLYKVLTEAFFADDPIDPLTIVETNPDLAKPFPSEKDAVDAITTLAARGQAALGAATNHAKIVKRESDLRALLSLTFTVQQAVAAKEMTPDQIAALASSEAMKIATDAVGTRHELVHFADAGRRFIRDQQERMALRSQGVSTGARFGISAIDGYTNGLQPTELLIGGGESGVGKSATWWKAAMSFAEGELTKPPGHQRVGTAIFSLEMGEVPSSMRWAQGLTSIDSAHMRDGSLSQAELQKIVKEWGNKKGFPLWMNYSPGMTLSQLRAVVAEGIRKHNIGLVVIDHFLLLQTDNPGLTSNEADDERIKFLKQQVAMDLNVAVVCLAHTRKDIERADKRPRLSDLRGSGMIAAFADYVMLMYRPWKYASDKEKDTMKVAPTDAEMIHAKNRHGAEGIGNFYFDPAKMLVV
jgi:replicative DNA helicase